MSGKIRIVNTFIGNRLLVILVRVISEDEKSRMEDKEGETDNSL